MCRALSSRVAKRWRFVSFRGLKGRESTGIVDIVAIRRDMSEPTSEGLKKGDLLDLILIQMKGRTAARPSPAEIARLWFVRRKYRGRAVVLYEWRRREFSRFSRLVGVERKETSAKEIFG